MKHAERLPECQEKFDGIDKRLNGGFWKYAPLGVVVTLIISLASYMGSCADKLAKADEFVNEKVDHAITKQAEINSSMLVALERIKVSVDFIKEKVK